MFAPVQLPEGPETIEQLEEHRAALKRIASEVPTESEKDRARPAHLQARAEAEKAYQDELLESLTPMDEKVFERRFAELPGQEDSTQ